MEDNVFNLHQANEDTHWWFVGRRRILDPLIAFAMKDRTRDLIVDVGCGTGGTVASLSSRYRCLGINSSEQAIGMARGKYPDCTFVCGLVPDDLRESADQVQLFVLMDVLEHIENDRDFLSDIVEIAKPGTYILITVPANQSLWSAHDEAAGHERRYDGRTFAALWRNLPVMECVTTPFNARLYPVIWSARVLGQKIGLFKGEGGNDLTVPREPVNWMLKTIFGGERARIGRMLDRRDARPYRQGVSMLALLQRQRST